MRILITGASQGLGEVCAKALSQDGITLVLMARNVASLHETKNGCLNPEQHAIVPADLLELSTIEPAMKLALAHADGLDAVIHCAGGGLGMHEPLLTGDALGKLLTLNLLACAEINRLAAPGMKKRGKGYLVHVGSVAAAEAIASVGYGTSKAALGAYVRTLGNEMARHGVVVTGIHPGGFHAPGNAMDRLRDNRPDVYEEFLANRLPRQFMGNAAELMPLIKLLISDGASMMGGSMIPIDAGEGKAFSTS
ncbi:MAG: SDR family oxidoreductase [Magnetococcales bacterium]|nr:SDR family oxidoreductase [Magnetococcales bacterium]